MKELPDATPFAMMVARADPDEIGAWGAQQYEDGRRAALAVTPGPEILVVNGDGVELAIERRLDGKWAFVPTTFDGQRPLIKVTPKLPDPENP